MPGTRTNADTAFRGENAPASKSILRGSSRTPQGLFSPRRVRPHRGRPRNLGKADQIPRGLGDSGRFFVKTLVEVAHQTTLYYKPKTLHISAPFTAWAKRNFFSSLVQGNDANDLPDPAFQVTYSSTQAADGPSTSIHDNDHAGGIVQRRYTDRRYEQPRFRLRRHRRVYHACCGADLLLYC